MEKWSSGFDFVANKYVICFGTTKDNDCNTSGGQIVPGEDIYLSVSSPKSGRIIIDGSHDNFLYLNNLELSNGYICNSKGEDLIECSNN